MASAAVNWRRLPNPPKSLRFGVSTNWNHDSFVIAPECGPLKSKVRKGVHRYNAVTKKWDIMMQYPKIHCNLWVTDIATDAKNDKLFICTNEKNGYLMAGNAKSKQLRNVFDRDDGGYQLGDADSIVHIRGQLHCFTLSSHLIWNGENGDRASLDKGAKPSWDGMRDGFESRFIAVPTKGIILLIGGRRATNWNGYDFEILKYSVESKKWSGTGIEFKYWRPTAVLTPSERYVILSGGKRACDSRFEEKIHVLDISHDNKWHLYESKVRVPMNVNHHLAVTGDSRNDYLVIGWTRELFKNQEYFDLSFPPLHLLELIGTWVWCEELHWIRKGKHALRRRWPNHINPELGALHYAVDLKHVLKH